MGNFAQEERINLAFKHALNIMGTMNLDGSLGRSWYEELYTNSHIVLDSDIWIDEVPWADLPPDADSNTVNYPTIIESYKDPSSFPNTTHGRLRLTIEPATNDTVLFARSIPGDPTSPILKDWLQPQKFGQGYTVRLFDSAIGGTEITTTQGQGWFFYWQWGCLILGNGTTPMTAFGVSDIYIEGYRYIGRKSVSSMIYCLRPDDASSIDATSLNSSLTFYTAKESAGNTSYEIGAGTQNDYTINNPTWPIQLTLQNPSTQLNKADQGVLELLINGVVIDSFDLESAFDESYRGTCTTPGQQGSTYDGGNGLPTYSSNYSGSGSYIKINSIQMYNNWPDYQIGNVELYIRQSDLVHGYNYVQLRHSGISPVQTTLPFKFFYDSDTSSITVNSGPSISENNPSLKYLSGVPYYGYNSTFNLDITVANLFANVYVDNPIKISNPNNIINEKFIAYNDSSVSGVSDPPNISETMTVSGYTFALDIHNKIGLDEKFDITLIDPYGEYSGGQTDSIRIYTYGPFSDKTHEYFHDEHYRITSDYDINTTPSDPAAAANWDSTQNILTGPVGYNDGLQVGINTSGNTGLIYPQGDYSTINPSGGPDYSGSISGIRYYLRMFASSDRPNSNGILKISGPTRSDIENGIVKVELCVPVNGAFDTTPQHGTQWLDLSKWYNMATFTGANGDGCRVSGGSGDEYYFTLGYYSTAYSNNCLLVRVSFDETYTTVITELSIIDW